jgi:hypothetical protein
MASQTRSSKRTIDAVEPESPNPVRTSARKKKPTLKASQTVLPFVPEISSQLSQISTTRRQTPDVPTEVSLQESTREPSEEPSQKSPTPSSRQPSSLTSSCTPSLRHKDTIEAKKRVAFEIDFAWIGQDYSYGKRTHRSIKNSRVS